MICMTDTAPSGCALCFQADAEALWQARPWRRTDPLIEDSHYGVSLWDCPACGQRFVQIFSEFVDWHCGDDAQHWDLVPITAAEAQELRAQGEGVPPERLGQLGEGRRRLQVDFPSGARRVVRFCTGAFWVLPGY